MNPKQINQYNENSKHRKDKFCPKCDTLYKQILYSTCPICGKQLVEYNNCLPKCPTCGSTNIEKISNAKRTAHGLALGFLSKTAFSQFECKNCGYKW